MSDAPHTGALPPTGRQYDIRHGDGVAVAVEAGGGLRSYAVGTSTGARDVIDGYGVHDRPAGGKGALLAPWPNRVRAASYGWHGQRRALAVTEPERGNAIHGLLRFCSWHPLVHTDDRVVLTATIWPQPGYPGLVSVAVDYRLGTEGLTVRTTASNRGTRAVPYGVGQHPYLTAGTARVDDAVLTLPAASWLRTDEALIPVATERVEGTDLDFREPRRIGAQVLDTAYTDLTRDPDGRARVRLATGGDRGDRAEAHGVTLWLGPGLDWVQLFTGDSLRPGLARRSLAVEPMSCAPDAFNSGAGLVTLEPGASHEVVWGMAPF